MDWLQKAYFKLWNKFGDKPFTEIWRDVYVKYEYIPLSIFFWSGVGVGVKFGWLWAGVIWLAFTIGYVFGHLHWQDKFLYKRVDE